MPLSKCPRCSKMFNKTHSKVCSVCEAAEAADAEVVRHTLDKNGELNAEQVAEMTGVDIAVVLRLIDQGSITCASDAKESVIRCGRCGAPAISVSKRLCQPCLEKLNAEVVMAQSSIRLDKRKQVEVSQFHPSVRHALEEKRTKE